MTALLNVEVPDWLTESGIVLLCGALVWSLLMIGCQLGTVWSDAWDRRNNRRGTGRK